MIFILGIDGLDFDLVEKLDLTNIKQLEHYKLNVPINKELGFPISAEVWSTFLTGKYVQKRFGNSSNAINILLGIMDNLSIKHHSGFGKKLKDLVKKIGFSAPIRFGTLKEKTFLDVTKSKEINVPFYSFDHRTFDISYKFGISVLTLEQSINETQSIYEMRKQQIINEIENMNNYDVVFAFIHTTDVLQHLSFLRDAIIKQHYRDLNDYVSLLKRKLKNSFDKLNFIIVSDHGFDYKSGVHSNHALYSSNNILVPKPDHISDFYDIIIKLIE